MDTNGNRPLAAVTGASSGIGRELAKQFASNGFDLIVATEAGGAFKDTELADELKIIDLNVRSTVHLAKYVVRDMARRSRSRSRSRSRCGRSSKTPRSRSRR
jgi:short-subunit dehydrogenase